jgi:hypothetical protein
MSGLSPLAEIEAAVQVRAQDIDVRTDAGRARLRALIDDEIATWDAEHRRGLRPFAVADPAGAADRAYRNLAGYGPLRAPPRRRRRLGNSDQQPRRCIR